MRHWAQDLVGLAWSAEFQCWDMVRRVVEMRHGVVLPEAAHDVLGIKAAARGLGLVPMRGLAQVDDIVLMTKPDGQKHVGYFVEADGRVGVLHNDGHQTPAGPVGCVGFDTLDALTRSGCRGFEYWRRAT